MKLRQNGAVSLSIKPGDPPAGSRAEPGIDQFGWMGKLWKRVF